MQAGLPLILTLPASIHYSIIDYRLLVIRVDYFVKVLTMGKCKYRNVVSKQKLWLRSFVLPPLESIIEEVL